jgi:glycosyltransferase involved in cell wall biosynthesis
MTVSIAMTTYNGDKFILEQLGSIFDQTRKPDEVIICDDGSSDQTTAIITDFIQKNKLINWHLCVNDNNLGYIENFYNAISRVTGDIIFLCDQDDVWHADKIAKMVGIIEENTAIKALNSGFQKIDQNGEPIHTKSRFGRSNNNLITQKLKQNEIKPFLFESIIWRNMSPGCTLAFTDEVKTFFLKNRTHLCPHDWEINLFGAVLGGLYFYNEALTGYRIHTGNTIGLADLKLADRLSGKTDDKRISQSELEYKRADAYMNAGWAALLGSRQRKFLTRYGAIALKRFQALQAKKLSLWLKLFRHPKDYLKLRGLQGMLNDFVAVLKKGGNEPA